MSRGLSLKDAVRIYGPIIDGKWADELKHMTLFDVVPYGLQWTNSATNGQVPHIYMNVDMVMPLKNALDNLILRGFDHELKTFDGCYCVRDVRGIPGQISAHSYGLAIDINAKENPLGGPVEFSQDFLQCFRDAGFDAGADFKRVDGMHFSYFTEGKS